MPAELTARERQCVELAAKGLTDDEIGHQLGISGRTVSVHLQKAFRKLGVGSRKLAAQRIGIDYVSSGLRISAAGPGGPDRGVPAAVEPAGVDSGPAPAAGLYGVYSRLGPNRQPRQVGGTLLPVILMWTFAGLLAILAIGGPLVAAYLAMDRAALRVYQAEEVPSATTD